ncbi:MAG TPA: endolytic transglycosylase MltG [Acetobacteraceae bacterium]|nr:endolytic transglycosylase MltG [Acetobacteraceae bacterium]
MRRVLIALAVVLVLFGALAGGAVMYARRVYDAPGPLAAARTVMVPRGGLDTVAAALQRAGVVADGRAFRIAALLTRDQGKLHAEELAFPAHASLRQVLVVLRTAPPVQHNLTIPEGFTAAQIAELLARTDGLSGDVVLPAEGSVLPQTYAYAVGATCASIVARAQAAMQRTLAREWAGRAPDLPLASPEQALILASIVERETGKPDERPMVAAVFLNRLRLGMKLQSDPTVVYAASGGFGTLDRPLMRADLEMDGPYNTYRVDGLPPAPICSPGVASLHAVLHPAATDALYFVADGSGGHVFARTLAEHDRNVAKWRAEEGAGRTSGGSPAKAN